MGFSRAKTAAQLVTRLIAAVLFLTLFSLPLHSHFSAPAQLSKECSCVHGSRTQMGLAPVQVSAAPALFVDFFTVAEPDVYVWRAVTRQAIRAPPYITSL